MQNSQSNDRPFGTYPHAYSLADYAAHLMWIIPIISILLFHYEGAGWFGSIFFTFIIIAVLIMVAAHTPSQLVSSYAGLSTNSRGGGKNHGKKRK
jgi:hypothetical protein